MPEETDFERALREVSGTPHPLGGMYLTPAYAERNFETVKVTTVDGLNRCIFKPEKWQDWYGAEVVRVKDVEAWILSKRLVVGDLPMELDLLAEEWMAEASNES